MEQVARRYIAAAAALTAGSLVAAIFTVTPALPDVQVRDADLAANPSGLDSQIDVFHDLFQREFGDNPDFFEPGVSGNADFTQSEFALEQILSDGNALNNAVNPTVDVGSLIPDYDQNTLNELPDGTLNLEGVSQLPGISVDTPDVNGFDGASLGPGGLAGAGGQAASAGTAEATAISLADAIPALQAAYDTFTAGVVNAELELNHALADAQAAAADKLFGEDSTGADVANWMFSVSNMMLAHNEDALNSLLGADADSGTLQDSLLVHFDANDLAQAGWAALLGLDPDDFDAVVDAAQSGSLSVLLNGLFPGVF
jgi:hypothetical protein